MKVLITRSQTLNRNSAAILHERGHDAVECSLVEVVDSGAPIPDGDFGGVIFTSQVAVEMLAARERMGEQVSRSLPVFAVGETTAMHARELGFMEVSTGEGGAEALAGLVRRSAIRKPLLYIAGVDRAVEFEKRGIETVVVEIYKARLSDPGKDQLRLALKTISSGCALFYSIRTATHLLEPTW